MDRLIINREPLVWVKYFYQCGDKYTGHDAKKCCSVHQRHFLLPPNFR